MLWEVGLWLYFHIICWSKKPSLYLVDTGFVMLRKNMESWHFVALSKPFLTKKNTALFAPHTCTTRQWQDKVWFLHFSEGPQCSEQCRQHLQSDSPPLFLSCWSRFFFFTCNTQRQLNRIHNTLCQCQKVGTDGCLSLCSSFPTHHLAGGCKQFKAHQHVFTSPTRSRVSTHTHYTYIIIIIIKTLYFLHFFFSDTLNTAPYII